MSDVRKSELTGEALLRPEARAGGASDPRRAKDGAKVAGGRYVVDPKTGAVTRTEGLGTDEHAAAAKAAAPGGAKKAKE